MLVDKLVVKIQNGKKLQCRDELNLLMYHFNTLTVRRCPAPALRQKRDVGFHSTDGSEKNEFSDYIQSTFLYD